MPSGIAPSRADVPRGEGGLERAMKGLIRRGRAWAPVTKSLALFLLPLPLLGAALAGLVTGDVGRLALAGGALTCVWGAGALSWRGLAAEARAALGERWGAPTFPFRTMSGAMTAGGAALAATAGGHELASAVVFAGVGALGYAALFTPDVRSRRIVLPAVEGVDRTALARQLERAYERLLGIEAAAHRIAVPEFGDRLERIAGVGRTVLAEIERDPRRATRARRFLNVYLDSAEQVTRDYARAHSRASGRALEPSFRELLDDLEHAFTEQHRALVDRDVLAVDVDIDVLRTRLKRGA
jgi:5-bromo-4-chloroindolyl phosphate hydrolysis protein